MSGAFYRLVTKAFFFVSKISFSKSVILFHNCFSVLSLHFLFFNFALRHPHCLFLPCQSSIFYLNCFTFLLCKYLSKTLRFCYFLNILVLFYVNCALLTAFSFCHYRFDIFAVELILSSTAMNFFEKKCFFGD